MNLTDKARRGSQEAMEALFDMTKNDVAYLCRLLLGDNQAASVAVPRIYRSLWEQVLAGRITTEEDFAQAALVKTAAFCKTVLTKKDSKSFRIPQNRDFVLGTGERSGKAPPLSPPRWRNPAPRRLPARVPPRPRRAPPFPKAPLFPRTPLLPKAPPWTAKPPEPERKASLPGWLFRAKKHLTDAPLCGYIKRVWRSGCRPWEEKRMEQKTLLITGFEPFQQETINPSWEAVALLPETIGPWRLEKLRLPVVFGKAADLAIARAQQLCPQAILTVGQAGGRGAVTPELVAINTRDAAIPDNEGNAFQGQPVVPGGGDGYFATAPVRQMVQAAAAQGFPCKLSYTAGAYVCNDLFYRLLHQYRGTGVLVDFIHVPFLPEQAKNGEPSMALADMARALEALILALEP